MIERRETRRSRRRRARCLFEGSVERAERHVLMLKTKGVVVLYTSVPDLSWSSGESVQFSVSANPVTPQSLVQTPKGEIWGPGCGKYTKWVESKF